MLEILRHKEFELHPYQKKNMIPNLKSQPIKNIAIAIYQYSLLSFLIFSLPKIYLIISNIFHLGSLAVSSCIPPLLVYFLEKSKQGGGGLGGKKGTTFIYKEPSLLRRRDVKKLKQVKKKSIKQKYLTPFLYI